MTLREHIAKMTAERDQKLAKRNDIAKELNELRGKDELSDSDQERIVALRDEKAAADTDLDARADKIREATEEAERDEKADREARERKPGADLPSYDRVARVGGEKRTYNPESDRDGRVFMADVLATSQGFAPDSHDRLARHMAEERVERSQYLNRTTQTTTNFAGLTVPQYLTDLVAPNAKAGRPLANICRKHDLPADGMTISLSKVTTGTTAAVQTQGSAVTESAIDDTQLDLSIVTIENWQTITRQVAERSTGALDVTLDDLIRGYHTTLDSTLINAASTGLTNVATNTAYTDASPTAAELYPKLLSALSGLEIALLDQSASGSVAVMHSRRWYWMQSQVGTSWPFIGQPGYAAQQGGANYGELYGAGFRGILPNGTPVVVDNNIGTTLGAGTEDEIYFVNVNEAHLWEDASAPMFIRADQAGASSLTIPLVVYGYAAYTFNRYSGSAQKISGTGLIAPVFA